MMSNIKEEKLKVEVKSEANLDNAFLLENEHPVGDSIDSMLDNYTSFKVKKELEYIDNEEPSADSLKQFNITYTNFICKEEFNDEGQSEISNEFKTENEHVSENSGADEKMDVSKIILQSSDYNDDNFKYENEDDSENEKAFTQRNSPDVDPLIQTKATKKAKPNNCQFCNKSFTKKTALEDHMLKQHKQELKGDIKRLITHKIHSCNICNSYESTIKDKINRHIRLNHEERIKIKCQFCTESFISEQSLEEHVLRKHKDMIKHDIKSFIKREIYMCKICNSYETTRKSNLDRHLYFAHNEVKNIVNCQFCNKSFAKKRSLDEHILKHHKQEIKGNSTGLITTKIHTCKICNSYETTAKYKIDEHVNAAHNEVKMKCQFCTESFAAKLLLDGHVLKKHKDKIKNNIKNFITSRIHVCKICNSFETMYKSSFNNHVNSTHSKITMKCQFCPKSFKLKQSLGRHVRKEHKDKIENNGKSFITSKTHILNNKLIVVKKLHQNEERKQEIYICDICSYQTKRKHLLINHFNSVHNRTNNINDFITKQIQICKICSYQTKNTAILDNHIASNHNNLSIIIQRT